MVTKLVCLQFYICKMASPLEGFVNTVRNFSQQGMTYLATTVNSEVQNLRWLYRRFIGAAVFLM